MTDDDILRMFHEAGEAAGWKPGTGNQLVINYLTRFAALVAAAEREACADILDRNADRCDPCSVTFDVLDSNAKAIRARSKK